MARIGFSKDIHALETGRKLVLGGVHVPFDKGERAHSDGDVVYHALMEAVLGALALGDLGKLFPVDDPKYDDIDSAVMAAEVSSLMKQKGYRLFNCDVFISLEKPRLSTYIAQMRENVSRAFGCDKDAVSIKAGTNEGFGEVGEGKAVVAYAIVLLEAE